MSFQLNSLPFDKAALEPIMSARTLELHYGKHHAGYVTKLNQMVLGTSLEKLHLETLVRRTARQSKQRDIYNNAAQIWNHDFFWKCLMPNGGGTPPESVRKRIESKFHSVDNFKERFVDAGLRQFGSGWVWLLMRNGNLDIVSTHDAESPITTGAHPLFVCDVWEHAYYLDYQNRRADFVRAVMDKLMNWQFVAAQLVESEHSASQANHGTYA